MPRISEGQIVAGFLITVVLFMATSPAISAHSCTLCTDDVRIGPYIEKVVFKYITDRDQEVLSLLSGDIDIMGEWVLPKHLPIFEGDPDISVHSALRDGYGHIDINCAKYPLNITGLRRAFAFAFDKIGFSADVLDGYSQEHDSLVPYLNHLYCIEDDLPYHYYDARPALGNQILDDLGFDIHPDTGYRAAPDGSPFRVIVRYSSESEEVAGGAARYAVEALNSLNIYAETDGIPFGILLSEIYYHRDYDMAFYATNYWTNDVVWLMNYNSELIDEPMMNPFNFNNKTYDSWCDALWTSISYEEAYEAAKALQLILHENVPGLIVYQNFYNQPYRNDVFTGHVGDVGRYLAGPWTMRKVHKLDGTFGGTLKVSIDGRIESFNPFVLSAPRINHLLWPSLFSIDPDLYLIPNLAKSMIMETHSDNEDVFEGNTRFTIDVVKNATWSDGTPITAEDVVFSIIYEYESMKYGNPTAATFWGDLAAAYAPSTHRAILEFNSESMWHFTHFAQMTVIPKHIFFDVIGYEGWNTWNPVFNPEHPYVTCGPFQVTDVEEGDFIELTANPDFYYYPQNVTTLTYPEPTTTPTFDASLALASGSVGAAVTVLVGGYYILRITEPEVV